MRSRIGHCNMASAMLKIERGAVAYLKNCLLRSEREGVAVAIFLILMRLCCGGAEVVALRLRGGIYISRILLFAETFLLIMATVYGLSTSM